MDWATYDRTMRLNVAAPFFLTQRFARHWVQNQVAGRVLMIGSINGRLAEPTHACYDTSKGAIDAMVRSLCVTLAPLGIRVNGLAPGLVRTPLTSIIDRDERFRRWMELHTPNQQVPHSDVCGGGAVFLCSDAAEHIQGQMLLVDGGMSWWQAMVTIVLGNLIVLVPMVLIAHPGTRYGIPFPVLARASFGTRGANVPAILRGLVACGWFGIQTWIGGQAIHIMLRTAFPAWERVPGAVWIAFFVFWIWNMYVVVRGSNAIKRLQSRSGRHSRRAAA